MRSRVDEEVEQGGLAGQKVLSVLRVFCCGDTDGDGDAFGVGGKQCNNM